jgi:hypothetical protein
MLLLLSSVLIFSSAPWSETPAVYVRPLMSETRFHTHTKPHAKLYFVYMNFYFLYNRRENKRFLIEW